MHPWILWGRPGTGCSLWVIVHKDGSHHRNVDAMFRQLGCSDSADCKDFSAGLHMVGPADCSLHPDVSRIASCTRYALCYDGSDLQSLQNEDPDISVVLIWLVQDTAQPLRGT